MAGTAEYSRNFRARRKALIWELKEQQGCFRCGITDPRVLDYHHTNPESKHIELKSRRGRALVSLGIEELYAEIEKCEVVCANCHRILTAEEGANG